MSTDTKSRRTAEVLPRWKTTDRNDWTDSFRGYCDVLMAGTLAESCERGEEMDAAEREQVLRDDLDLAARLADAAVEQMRARFNGRAEGPMDRRRKR